MRLYWLIDPEISHRTIKLGHLIRCFLNRKPSNSPPCRIAARKVRAGSTRAVRWLALVRRDAIGFTGNVRRDSMRFAAAISAVLICSKSSVFNRSFVDAVKDASTSTMVSSFSSSASGFGISGCMPSNNASAARFSAAWAARSSWTPRTAGNIMDIMCSKYRGSRQ